MGYITRIQSDKNAEKSYIVEFDGTAAPTCTCMAYVIGRNRQGGKEGIFICKHIEREFDNMMAWKSDQNT